MNFATPVFTTEQELVISALNDEDLKRIDEAILSSISSKYFYKINRIVGEAMMSPSVKDLRNIPDLFYANRTYLLINKLGLSYTGEFEFGKCEIKKTGVVVN